MKSFDTQLKKYAEKVRLKAAERRELRERILTYMEYHPLPKQKGIIEEKIESERFVMVHFNTIYTRIAAGVCAVLLLIVIPVAAERSVPGDVLYLVKTGINEGIQAQFANSPYEKVALETKLMERRIAEARLLAQEGKLTEEVEAQIAETVKEHADAAQVGLAELREDNAEEAAIAEIAFGSALEVQSAVLETNTSMSATSSTEGIKSVVQNAQVEVLLTKSTTTPSYEGLMARVESETTRAYELFESINTSATEDERTDIERRLSDIDRKIIGAQEKKDTDEEDASHDLAAALGIIQKLIVFMTDIDVRETVALETLVPVELTPEERTADIRALLDEVVVLHDTVSVKVPLILDEGLHEKVVFGIEQLDTRITDTTDALAADNIAGAEGVIAEAYALAMDLDLLTLHIDVDETSEERVPEEDETREEEGAADSETEEGTSEGIEEHEEAVTTEETETQTDVQTEETSSESETSPEETEATPETESQEDAPVANDETQDQSPVSEEEAPEQS